MSVPRGCGEAQPVVPARAGRPAAGFFAEPLVLLFAEPFAVPLFAVPLFDAVPLAEDLAGFFAAGP